MSNTNPLLNNDSVQGAAKSIEGLMDTKGVIKKPQEEAAPVEPKEEVKRKQKQKLRLNNKLKLNKRKLKKLQNKKKHPKMRMRLKNKKPIYTKS